MRSGPLQVTLLTRFYLVAVLLTMTVFSGTATGFGLFFRLIYIFVLTLLLNYVWNWLTMRSLEVKVDRRTRQVRVGDTIEEQISVTNHSRLPKFALEVLDLTDLPGYAGGMAVSLDPGDTSALNMKLPARRRGVYRLGPISVSNSDPLGLFRREVQFGRTDELIVFPRVHELPGFEVPAAELSGDSSSRKKTHQVTPHASTIRDYTSGDSLSRVHWRSTARLGKLMSKEFDLGRAGEVWIVVDLHKDVQAGELDESTDEYAVSIAASLAKRYLQAQMPVGLVSYGDKQYFLQAETGAGQVDRIMHHLAMTKAEGATPLENLLASEESLWSHNSSLVVITASPRPQWVMALRELAKRNVRIAAILLDGRSFGGFLDTLSVLEEIYLTGLPTYLIRKGDDIPSALSQTLARDGTRTPEALEELGATA